MTRLEKNERNRHMLWPHRRMSVVSRYVAREFMVVFLLSIGAFNVVYLVIDFFQSVTKLLEYKAPLGLALEYYLMKVPVITFQTIPLAVLLSTLVTLGILSRHMEITALKANGISLFRITRPIFFLSLVIACLTFVGNEYLAPYACQRAEYIMDTEAPGIDQKVSFKNLNIWYRQDSEIYNFQAFDPKYNSLKGVTIYRFDKNFRLVQRVDAHDAVWNKHGWTFNNVIIRKFRANQSTTIERYPKMDFPMDITPASLRKVEKDTEAMGYGELKRYVARLEKAGYDATKYLVDLQIKISFPFINLIMVLIGIPFALRTGRTGGFAAGIGISLAIGFIYWILISVSRAFGHSGILPPLLSAWVPHLLFGGAGLVAFLSVRQ
ncbi:MAG: LPS export ABC transporter permease LptG [Deltaproteobacteria bacterium]|nr:LPS export ABC transporter permease LptG [Deltaproteobacteria bacterium]